MPASKTPPPSHLVFIACLAIPYLFLSVTLGLEPYDRDAWSLEHIMVAVGILLLFFTYRSFPLSRVSYTCIFIFLCSHEVGAHYTYARVPYDAWSEALTGRSISSLYELKRNHYDRFVHFLYGLLLAWPYREAFLHAVRGNPPPFWSYLLPLTFTVATSVIYEFAEWATVMVFGGDAGMAFLGTQGDEWDSHHDTFCAIFGAILTTLVMIAVHLRTRRDFPAEWAEKHT